MLLPARLYERRQCGFGDSSYWILVTRLNREEDARTLLESKIPFAREPSQYLSASCFSYLRLYPFSRTLVLVGAQRHPSTSTTFLAKLQRLGRWRFRRPCIWLCDNTNSTNALIDGDGFCIKKGPLIRRWMCDVSELGSYNASTETALPRRCIRMPSSI